MKLVPVSRERQAINILYDLLAERTPEQSISHKGMPTMDEHAKFVRSLPYRVWHLIKNDDGNVVGSIYLTKAGEIGVAIFKTQQRKGYARWATIELMKRWPHKRFLFNVNPKNAASIALWESLGAKIVQVTLSIEKQNADSIDA